MSRIRVNAFGISLDGYGAGPEQDLANPMGVGGMALHQWVFGTKTFRKMHADFAGPLIGDEVGRGGVDDDFAARGFENVGAWILGRNMFGPVRGPWSDDSWKGWWGNNPPYHVPVFVLTHHARAPVTMEGGTTFHFVTDGIHAALKHAKEAARGKDVRLGGGVATIRQYLAAGLIDEIHLVLSSVLLGRGEHLLAGIDTVRLGYQCTEKAVTDHATHAVLTKEQRRTMDESFEHFRKRALAAGADEALEKRWAPGQIVEPHTHPFDADAVVYEGEMWLTCAGETRHLRPGDTFSIPKGTTHSEKYGPQGAAYWVARRS